MSYAVDPLALAVLRDRGTSPLAKAVWAELTMVLDDVDYRPVKRGAIARALAIDEAEVSRALQLLVTRGFLERGDRDGSRGAFSYRLSLPAPSMSIDPPFNSLEPPSTLPPTEGPRAPRAVGRRMISRGIDG